MGEGFLTSILKPHILKHHIPEHPKNISRRQTVKNWYWRGCLGGGVHEEAQTSGEGTLTSLPTDYLCC